MNTRHTVIASPIGDLTIVATGHALTGLYFPHHCRLELSTSPILS